MNSNQGEKRREKHELEQLPEVSKLHTVKYIPNTFPGYLKKSSGTTRLFPNIFNSKKVQVRHHDGLDRPACQRQPIGEKSS